MLIIKAKGGLGNRLLSAATAIAYAESTSRQWCIDWRDGLYASQGVNSVALMFDIKNQASLADLKNSDAIVPSLWEKRVDWPVRKIISLDFPKQHSNPLIYRKLSSPFKKNAPNNTTEVFWSYTSKLGRIKPFLLGEQRKLRRDEILSNALKAFLKPQARIITRADELLAGNSHDTLGVHIRYTDLKVPIEKLIIKVKNEMTKFNYRFIFLATDSAYAEEIFNKAFSSVVTQKKRYSVDNAQLHSVEDYDEKPNDADVALIDMMTLSKCRGLVYCSRSTFAETSRLYGDFDPKRLTDIDRFNLIVNGKRWLQEYL